jgi:histidine triad (HIT) family protein
VIGLEVPHAHVHLIPINGVADMNFEKPKLTVSQEELAATAALIRNA